MFAVLPTIMDLSAGCRPSQSMSPGLRPTIQSPPALIPMTKIESDFIKTEDAERFPRESETPQQNTDIPITGGGQLVTEAQPVAAPNTYWRGGNGVEGKNECVNPVVTESLGQERFAANSMQHATPSTYPTIDPNLSIPQNISLQQISVLSQQMIAAVLSLQQRLQQANTTAALGNLLPPPPDVGSANNYQAPSQNIAYSPSSGSTVPRLAVAPTSIQSDATQSLYGSSTSRQENDLPLDLSKPTTEKDHAKNQPPSPSTTKAQYDASSIASIRSNFPTLFSSKTQNSSKKRKTPPPPAPPPLLLNTSLPSSSSPVHNNSMQQWVQSQASSDTSNQLAASQLHLHNWLLAAMSVQKMQQLALGRTGFFQGPASNQDVSPAPPRKRKLDQTYNNSKDDRTHHSQSTAENGNPSHIPKARKTPPYIHGTNKPSESPSTKPATSTSPNSDHSQPGKRYRRYAKPPYSYVSLITLAILSSREKKLRLSQILKRISEMFPFFNGTYQGWRDSVRHNLSQNECFVKVLKNPYRPTAKGNFWTVNLNSIPHELLLRQNTLVSRYAQDSGYRYRKDLTEVFNLRTGALKVPIPRHLLKNADNPELSMLCDDPAAVMEAILLEETDEDEMHNYNDKVTPDLRQFTLEDLFNQGEDYEDDSLHQSGRGRNKTRQKTGTVITHLPQSTPKIVSFPERQYSMSNRPAVHRDNSASYPFNTILPKDSGGKESLYSTFANGNANPFAAHQTAVLAKALSARMPSLGLPSLVCNDNQCVVNPERKDAEDETIADTSAALQRHFLDSRTSDYNTDQPSDLSPFVKKSKRKGAQPTRHSESMRVPYSRDVNDNSAEADLTTSNVETTSIRIPPPLTKSHTSHVTLAANPPTDDTTSILFQPSHAVDSSVQASHM